MTVGHADGRDVVDIALSEAFAPVLRDLGTCGARISSRLPRAPRQRGCGQRSGEL